ncbi:MAG: hypothetical protein JNK23_19740 [Opitutaceae bacterium]|nr:hypothetical protein [Opitutaceae bacterium]
MKKFVLAPFLGALATFLFGFIYWGLPPHLAYKPLSSVPDVSATALAIGKLFPASGTYLLPNPLDGEAKMNELAARGPSVEVHIRKESFTGGDMGRVMVLGFVHMFVVCLLVSILLTGLSKAFVRWTCRVKFCASLGLLVAVGELSYAIWWHHPLGWTLAHAIYLFLIFVIIGFVLAKFVTPKEPAPAA